MSVLTAACLAATPVLAQDSSDPIKLTLHDWSGQLITTTLMGEVLKENNLSKGMKKISIEENWASLMGNGVVSYTQEVTLKGTTLYVKLNSSVLREELSYGKEKIRAMMNEALGKEEIKKIMFLSK